MRRTGIIFWSYLRAVVVTLAVGSLGVLSINLLVDPFWFFGGNKVFPENLPFNERASKTNVFLKAPESYDCLILGSSRVTLLDESRIDGHHCFNYAFSNGSVREFVEFAEFARSRGMAPRRVIVGINEEQFWPIAFKSESPNFVRQMSDPPTWGAVYYSLRALGFSMRTLLRQYPLIRYYDKDFKADALVSAPPFAPRQLSTEAVPQDFELRSLGLFHRLLDVFPDAEHIGYAPPLSVWWVQRFEDAGRLDAYLAAIHGVAQIFDRFYDFAIPSVVTSDTANTYDGEHFFRPVNAEVARVLNGQTSEFGVDLQTVSSSEYRQQFRSALDQFLVTDAQSPTQDGEGDREVSMVGEPVQVGRSGASEERTP